MKRSHLLPIGALGVVAAASFFGAAARADFEPAGGADEFVDRIGVCTHLGYDDTPYGYAYDRVRQLLGASGIRHIRDEWNEHDADLHHDFGIKTTLLLRPPLDPAAAPAFLQAHLKLLDMVEGPNEPDVMPGSALYHGLSFPEGPRLYMDDLYRSLKANTATAGIGITGPSTRTIGAAEALAPLRSLDYLPICDYPGAEMPSAVLDASTGGPLDRAYDLLGQGAALKPIVATESGYHTALGGDVTAGGAVAGVSERAQAKYLLRLLCLHANAGIVRTFVYELVDEFPDYGSDPRTAMDADACFGLIKRDLTPKPAYTALRNLISILTEQRWDAAAGRWKPVGETETGTRYAAGALDFTLSGDTQHVRHTLLEKETNGRFYLILWREIPSFDPVRQADLAPSPAQVTLTVTPAVLGGRIFRPYVSAEPRQTFEKEARIALSVPDDPLIVEISPAADAATRNQALPAPENVTQKASTDTSVTLAWAAAAAPHGHAPAGYFVYRMGAFVGRTTRPEYTDTGLRPGSEVTYAVRSYDAAGRMSPPVAVSARTRAGVPRIATGAGG